MPNVSDTDKIATSCVIAAAEPDQLMSLKIMNTHNLSLDQTETQQHPDETHNPKRNRAWRRKTNYLHRGCDQKRRCTRGRWSALKNWKHLSTSGLKRSRARQLKIEYPRISNQQRKLNAQQDFWNTSD